MQIIICEDDTMFQMSILEKIEYWSEVSGHGEVKVSLFSSSEDLLEKWGHGINADVIFLDIQFDNELNGMELARLIRLTDAYVPIVFITNSEAYIREGYAIRALRYLGKPISYSDIAPCLDIAYKQHSLSHHMLSSRMEWFD